MTRQEEADLFNLLARVPAFREWLEQELSSKFEVLSTNPEPLQLFKAQGGVQVLKAMKSRVEAARKAAG